MKRSGKFYRKNEAEVMKMLGLKPTINSGSGWIEKEDGQSDNIICQLKSSDAKSIKVNKSDLDTLNYNALVTHKMPIFAIQFLQSNEIYLLVKPEMLCEAARYIETGETIKENEFIGINLENYIEEKPDKPKKIKSSAKARSKFIEEVESKYKKKGRSAK